MGSHSEAPRMPHGGDDQGPTKLTTSSIPGPSRHGDANGRRLPRGTARNGDAAAWLECGSIFSLTLLVHFPTAPDSMNQILRWADAWRRLTSCRLPAGFRQGCKIVWRLTLGAGNRAGLGVGFNWDPRSVPDPRPWRAKRNLIPGPLAWPGTSVPPKIALIIILPRARGPAP